MARRLFVLAVLCLFVCSLSSSFAQMSDEQYQAQLKAIKGKLNQARNGYI